MRRLLFLSLFGCGSSSDPCESVEGYASVHRDGYTDGSTCAAYDNPYAEDAAVDSADTASGSTNTDNEANSDCLWTAYDEGFDAGRAGADCSAGFD